MKKREHSVKDKNKIVIIMLIFLAFIIVVLLGMMLYWRSRILNPAAGELQTYDEFSSHYVMITDEGNSTFWVHVYEGAREYGKENDVYIERMSEESAVRYAKEYSKEELMEIAIYSKVDGILLEGDESSSQKEMINIAVEAGIPVVTMLNDNYGSSRQAFVGIGNYNLGREYAREVIKIATKDTNKVLILGNQLNEGTAHNLILSGFTDTIQNEGNHLDVETEIIMIDGEDTFSAQEAIRDILFEESQLPDIIICLSEVNTINTYQAIVDYNMVGQVKIIGYYISDTVCNAIDKQVLYSTLVFDAEEMGLMAVEALNEYRETGYVNDYITIEAEVINKSNIGEYLENEQKTK